MKDYTFIKNKFIDKHKNIDNYQYLDKYIDFLLEYKLDSNNDEYTEKHHILPQSIFPEYKNKSWNIVELLYDDHKLVHLWIFKAINIRTYQRPLNWMMNYYKNKEEISNAAKRGWKNLKQNKEKFKKFKENRSKHMKTLSSEEQCRRANIYWNNMTDEEYIKRCNYMKNLWTDEKKKEKSENMIKYYSDPKNIIKKSKEAKKHWDSLNKEERKLFKEKMDKINKDKTKRKDACEKIKNLWKDPTYKQKMENRKTRPGTKIKIIKPNGNKIIFNTMTELTNELQFSAQKIRKYRDTNKKILKEDLNKNNMELENCIVKIIKN